MRDLYEVLGVPKDADQASIRKSFKKLAREFHPDLNKDPKAADRFKEVSAAYEVLGDEGKRSLYDEFGEVSLKPGFDADQARRYKSQFRGGPSGPGGFGGFGGGVDIEEILGSFFGGGGPRGPSGGFGGGRAGPAAGADIESNLRISLLDVIKGRTETITVRRPGRCGTCNGEGGTGKATCMRCGGMGHTRMGPGFGNFQVPCDDCGGSGTTFAQECVRCAGTGRTMTTENLKVHIPPGVAEGQVIRLRGKGGEGQRGGPAGDLLLAVEIAPHPLLERDGSDLILEVPLTIAEAMRGGRIEVPTPDGPVRVNVPAGATSGQRLRLRGKGVPTAGGRGDLYLVLRPTPPARKDAEAIKLAEALDPLYDRDVRADLKL